MTEEKRIRRGGWTGRLLAGMVLTVCLLLALAGTALAATKPVITVQPSDATVAAGQQVSYYANAAGDPKPVVQWLQRAPGETKWTPIPGAKSTTYKFLATSAMNGFQFKALFTNSAGHVYCRGALLTIRQSGQAPLVTMQPVTATVEEKTTATFSAAAAGTPTPTVQWQQSSNGTTWTFIAGAVRPKLSFTANKAQNGYKFRAVFTNSNGQAVTKAATLKVVSDTSAPVVTLQPFSKVVKAGATVVFKSLASGDPAPTVQWQISQHGAAWKNIPRANSTTYSVVAKTYLSGNRYRARFTNSAGAATSYVATLTVGAISKKPVIVVQPVSTTVNSGETAVFTASATGKPAPKVQWQQSANGKLWTLIRGATKQTYSFKATTAKNGYRYRAIFRNSAGGTTTKAAKLSVINMSKPVVTVAPVSQTVVAGTQASFTADASGTPSPSVQWQQSSNGTTWSNISGATSKTYTFSATAAMNGRSFRAVFTNTAGKANSAAAQLTVIQGTTAPHVNINPADQTVTAGAIATFSAAAVGVPAPTCQWQLSTDNGVTFGDIAGATSTTLQVPTNAAMNGYKYRALFTNSAGQAATTVALLTVWTAPAITAQPTDAFGTYGDTVSFTVGATGNPAVAITWYTSSDGVNWDPTPVGSGATLYVTILGGTNSYFHAVVSNAAGTVTSNTVAVHVL